MVVSCFIVPAGTTACALTGDSTVALFDAQRRQVREYGLTAAGQLVPLLPLADAAASVVPPAPPVLPPAASAGPGALALAEYRVAERAGTVVFRAADGALHVMRSTAWELGGRRAACHALPAAGEWNALEDLSPGGRWVAVNAQAGVLILDTRSGELVATLRASSSVGLGTHTAGDAPRLVVAQACAAPHRCPNQRGAAAPPEAVYSVQVSIDGLTLPPKLLPGGAEWVPIQTRVACSGQTLRVYINAFRAAAEAAPACTRLLIYEAELSGGEPLPAKAGGAPPDCLALVDNREYSTVICDLRELPGGGLAVHWATHDDWLLQMPGVAVGSYPCADAAPACRGGLTAWVKHDRLFLVQPAAGSLNGE